MERKAERLPKKVWVHLNLHVPTKDKDKAISRRKPTNTTKVYSYKSPPFTRTAIASRRNSRGKLPDIINQDRDDDEETSDRDGRKKKGGVTLSLFARTKKTPPSTKDANTTTTTRKNQKAAEIK